MKAVFFYILTYAKVISQNIRQLISMEPKEKKIFGFNTHLQPHPIQWFAIAVHSSMHQFIQQNNAQAKFETSIIQWPENEHKQENVVEMLHRHPLWGIGVWSINKIASLNDDSGCSSGGGEPLVMMFMCEIRIVFNAIASVKKHRPISFRLAIQLADWAEW